MRGATPRILLCCGAALLSGGAGLAAWEAWLRARHDGRIERITGVAPWQTASFKGLTYSWDAYHPTLGWTNLAGYRSADGAPFRLTINGQGLRADREYAERPRPGVRRVAVFGDSFVFGEEVDDDHTLPRFLEREIDGAEVLNFGVHGYGLGQAVLRLEEEGVRFFPHDVVLVVLVPQDVARTAVPRFVHEKPVFRVARGTLVVENVPVPVHDRQPFLLRHSFVAAHLFGRPRESVVPTDTGATMAVARKLLERARARCDGIGARLWVVAIIGPGEIAAMATDPDRAGAVASMRRGLAAASDAYLDLCAPLAEAHARRGAAIARPGGHWSGEGNRMIARWIARSMTGRQGDLPDPTAESRAAGEASTGDAVTSRRLR